jgi:MoxR-like ATPase
MEQEREHVAMLEAQLARVVIGKEAVIRLVLVALLAGGHVLLVDVPGVAKTRLARALAASLRLSFARIQATPDLLPGDIVGVSVYDLKTQEFHYRPGPVFHHIVLVDELNRATPRTQSALLECMEERQATVDGVSRPVPEPFCVVATQNPVEMEGTYPLPEAQLDRFLLAAAVGYPERADEVRLVAELADGDGLGGLEAVAGPEDVLRWRSACQTVRLDPVLREYVVDVVRATRDDAGVRLGASPRASLALARAARALAWLEGRPFVRPDDVQRLAVPVLAHRLLVSADSDVMGRDAAWAVQEAVGRVPVPTETVP